MKFKIGDKVRINTREIGFAKYGDIGVVIGYSEGSSYPIILDINGEEGFGFKESELELYKEDKMEKTFQEVIRDIKPGEVWESENNSCDIRVTRTKTGISIRDFNDNAIVWFDDNFRFKLKRKEYTFQEAFAAYEEGKEIQSVVTGIKCQKRRLPYENEIKDYCYYNDDLKEFAELKEFTMSEIKGNWYINE